MRALLRKIYLQLFGTIKQPQPGIHIINSHFVSTQAINKEKDWTIFERYISYLNSFAEFITLEEATKRINEKDIPKDKVMLAFTYDDGFEECYTVIAPLLEKYNTRGTFFINANYIDSDNDYQKRFNERVALHTKKPMSWKQVVDLHSRGHLIGSHNLDHTDFSQLNESDIEHQLKQNKEILESNLNYNCEYFAWTYGQSHHFPPKALKITEKYHKYIFSGTNYKSYFSIDGKVINRRHQEPFWPKSNLKYFLSVKKKWI